MYPAGRLDRDSEGLVVLTNDGKLQHRITAPNKKLPKTYRVQVEGEPIKTVLTSLRNGVMLNDGPAIPARTRRIGAPDIAERQPPVRFGKHIPTTWLDLILTKGCNRQVRRMTATVGQPTLCLIRIAIGPWRFDGLAPGEHGAVLSITRPRNS